MTRSLPQIATLLAPVFAGARKPYQQYVDKITLQVLYRMYMTLTAATLTPLATAFYPDQLKLLLRDLTRQELTHLAAMNVATLQSFSEMNTPWVRSMLRIIASPPPTVFADFLLGAVPPAYLVNANGVLDQTSTQPALQDTVLTERRNATTAVRNLVFNAAGNCIAEINFANHGGTAVSGHAHVYPVMCVPLTGHHAMGTPHVDGADCPAAWGNLPGGVLPLIPLGM